MTGYRPCNWRFSSPASPAWAIQPPAQPKHRSETGGFPDDFAGLSRDDQKIATRRLRFPPLWGNNPAAPPKRRDCLGCGCSSGVEHNLAKVGVEGSNPFARSRQSQENQALSRRPSGRFLLPRPLRPRRGSSRKHLPRCALQHENAALLARPRKRYGRVEHPLDDNCARCGRHSRHCLRAPSSNQLGYSSTPI